MRIHGKKEGVEMSRRLKTDKSTMTYEEAVAHVSFNEGDGDDERLKLDHVSSLVSVCIVADIFGVSAETFARAIIKYRRNAKC